MVIESVSGVAIIATARIGVFHAGALLTPDTLMRAAAMGLDARRRLDDNDGHGFFSALGDLIVTGPTRTNVNDFRAILLLPR